MSTTLIISSNVPDHRHWSSGFTLRYVQQKTNGRRSHIVGGQNVVTVKHHDVSVTDIYLQLMSWSANEEWPSF